jgi:hypothetical protein
MLAAIPVGEHFGEPGKIGFEVAVCRTAFLVGGVVGAVSLEPTLPMLGCIHRTHPMTTLRQSTAPSLQIIETGSTSYRLAPRPQATQHR